jgi:hypothetical protein
MLLSLMAFLEDLCPISVAQLRRTQSHDAYSPHRTRRDAKPVISMSLDMVDLVWSLMRDGEFYSPADLANTLGQPTDTIVRILKFLARYNFAERMTKRELIFRKIPAGPGPSEAAKILRMLRANATLNKARQVANISKTSRRLNLT